MSQDHTPVDLFAPETLGARLVEEMSDALVVSDREGAIRVWNKAAERIFGFSEAEALGESLDIITPERLRARHWQGYDQTMRTGRTRYGAGDLLSVPAIRKDGRTISVQFSILPLTDAEGEMQGVAAIMRDVTDDFAERKALRAELARLKRG
ncbi:PAS domain S-box-containing protein [Albimonas donghaensis]|uniref:PAS domain S-box-containing protein n=1 Tax=Albimonas donghaensis TaxID=356660 RepID=A0A1H3A079_9RHOB|nr:PAS domain S-box protein [Albimonas donghaensis]SDX23035.1 PAS domain S-box-containing protein [Albimonas donghaensis]